MSSERKTTWKPIESAPKDGSPVLIGCPHNDSFYWISMARYDAKSFGWYTPAGGKTVPANKGYVWTEIPT